MRDSDNQTNTDPGTAIVLWKEPEPDKEPGSEQDGRKQVVKALVWTIVGGMACVFSQVFGAAMVGYGLAFANGFTKKRSVWLGYALSAILGATAAALYDGQALSGYLVGYVTIVVSTLVTSKVMKGKGSITVAYAAAGIAILALMAIDFVPIVLQGVSPEAAVENAYEYVVQEVQAQTDISMLAALNQMKSFVLVLWPLAYAMLGFSVVIGSYAGSRMATVASMAEKVEPWRLSSFVAPKWSVIVLVASVSLLALSFVVSGSVGDVFRIVGLNIAFLVRFVFALQGFAVLTWFLQTRRIGCILRIFILFLAVDLEMSFFALSIVGLIDVWAKFREPGKSTPGAPPNPTLPTA